MEKRPSKKAYDNQLEQPLAHINLLLRHLPEEFHDIAGRIWCDGWLEGGMDKLKDLQERKGN